MQLEPVDFDVVEIRRQDVETISIDPMMWHHKSQEEMGRLIGFLSRKYPNGCYVRVGYEPARPNDNPKWFVVYQGQYLKVQNPSTPVRFIKRTTRTISSYV